MSTRILYVDDSDLHRGNRVRNMRAAAQEIGSDFQIKDVEGYAEALLELKKSSQEGKKYDAVICDSILSGAFGSRPPLKLIDITDGSGAQELALSLRSGRVVKNIVRHVDGDIAINYDSRAEGAEIGFKDANLVFVYCGAPEDFEKIRSRPSLNEAIDFYMPCNYLDNKSSRPDLQDMLNTLVDRVKTKSQARG
jgi:hypothetical protein